MCAKIKFAAAFGLCLCLCFLFPSCTPVYAQESYTITAAQLSILEANLSRLEASSKHKQTLLETQQEQLKTLNEQLLQSLKLNEETQASLQNAEESWKQYEAAQKRALKVRERQRDTWAAAFGIALAWACVK